MIRVISLAAPALLVLIALAGMSDVLEAQDPPPAPDEEPPTELVFEREVFQYPTFQRRNPFLPLDATNDGGPRFEQLRLMGIIHSEVAGESVAILGTSQVNVSADGANATVSPGGQGFYLKVGQSIGNTRIVEIRRDQVVVEFEEFGLTEQRIMQLATRRDGGTP